MQQYTIGASQDFRTEVQSLVSRATRNWVRFLVVLTDQSSRVRRFIILPGDDPDLILDKYEAGEWLPHELGSPEMRKAWWKQRARNFMLLLWLITLSFIAGIAGMLFVGSLHTNGLVLFQWSWMRGWFAGAIVVVPTQLYKWHYDQ